MNYAIIIPTYNEIGNITRLLAEIQKTVTSQKKDTFDVYIIDDNSPDGTAEVVSGLAGKLNTSRFSIQLLSRKQKDGLGKAYIFGFGKVLAVGTYDYILQMDADLSHDPKYIASFLYQSRKGADFIVASRYIPGGGTPDWPWYRKFLSRGGNIYIRTFLGSAISDYTGGFNMYSAALLKKMHVDDIQSGGYGFLIELKYRALRYAKHTAQIPIVFLDRTQGTSKIPKNILLQNFLLVPRIKFGHYIDKR